MIIDEYEQTFIQIVKKYVDECWLEIYLDIVNKNKGE